MPKSLWFLRVFNHTEDAQSYFILYGNLDTPQPDSIRNVIVVPKINTKSSGPVLFFPGYYIWAKLSKSAKAVYKEVNVSSVLSIDVVNDVPEISGISGPAQPGCFSIITSKTFNGYFGLGVRIESKGVCPITTIQAAIDSTYSLKPYSSLEFIVNKSGYNDGDEFREDGSPQVSKGLELLENNMPELVTLDHITNAEQLDLGKESQRIDRNKNILEKSHASTQEGNQTAEWILEVITSLTSTPPHLSKVLEKIVGLRINLGWSPTQIQDLEKVIVDYVNRTSDNQNLLDKLSGELKSCQEAAAKRVQEARDGKSSEEQLSQQLQEAQNARRVVEKEKNDALGTVHDYKNRITKMQKDYINFLSWTGFDYKSKRPGGWTALHGAALVDSRELVELFVGLGADVDARTDKVDSTYGTYQTPLHIAAKNGEPGIAAGALIDARALVEARDGGGMTPLITAITYGRISTIRHLVARGAGVSTPNDNGETPLSKAIEINSEEIVRYLLDRGANIEAGRSGYTPLMLAIVYQRKEMVVALVEHGAYVNAKSTVGSPLSLALQGNDKSIVDFLRSRGAR